MKKICFFLRSHFAVSTGGAELQGHYLADNFVKKGWDVHYILEEKGSSAKPNSPEGMTFHWIKQREAGSGLLNYFQLSKILRQIVPDVIYQRGALDYTGIVGLLARQHKMKYIWAAASNKDCQKRKYAGSLSGGAKTLRKLIKYPKFMAGDRLAAYGIKHADVAVVQSRDQQKLLAEHFGKSSQLIRSGHPLPDSLARKSPVPTVLWTANIKAWKRVESFVALARACQDLPAKFLVIGSDRRKSLDNPSTAGLVGQNFQYLGPLHVREVETYMCDASVFVNTSSKDYEGFPNTFIQAWMRKTPVISLNTDPDDVIKKYQLGFHSGTFDQMVRDLRLLLTDYQLRQHMGQNAYRYAVKKHNIHNTVDALEKLIISLS